MIICSKCGKDNDLGRVFCTSCGAKLDLTHMTTQSMADNNKESWMSVHGKKLLLIPLILVIALVGLVLWPNMGVPGEKGTPSGSRRIEQVLVSLNNLKPNQKTSQMMFSEIEINSYLENVIAKKAKIDSMSVSLKKGLVVARMVKVFARLGNDKFKVPIALSYDVKCVPTGNMLVVHKASIGHVKLFGPFFKLAESAFAGVLASETQLACLKGVEDLKVDDGKLSLIVSKK